jgi:hypothetical protein
LTLLTSLSDETAIEEQPLLPPMPADGYFKWAYPVPGTGIYLSMSEAEANDEQQRVAEIEAHCKGPSMGSAGGATLQPLGAVARFSYHGLLNDA